MSKIYYSTDNEIFNFTEIYEAVEASFDDMSVKIGDILTIYSGEGDIYPASYYAGLLNIVEYMRETAYDISGESADSWPEITDHQEYDLLEEIRKTIDIWADKNKCHPYFYNIKNVKEIKIKLLDIEGKYSIINME